MALGRKSSLTKPAPLRHHKVMQWVVHEGLFNVLLTVRVSSNQVLIILGLLIYKLHKINIKFLVTICQ